MYGKVYIQEHSYLPPNIVDSRTFQPSRNTAGMQTMGISDSNTHPGWTGGYWTKGAEGAGGPRDFLGPRCGG